MAPNNRVLATASEDGTTKRWDISAFSADACVLTLVLIGRRRLLPHVPQELWRMIINDFF